MSFVTAGPNTGFPVVYCHGAIGSPRWRVPGLDAVLERLSIRYLVVDRPGFGRSDPSPGRTVADFAADLDELTRQLGHGRFSVVGVSAGAPYALACAWALADRVSAVAAVSPLGPASGPGSGASLRYRVPMVPFGTPRVGPATAGLCLRALGFHRTTSAQAMMDDYRVCRAHWGFELDSLRVPVTVWHARRDRLVPVRHALTLAEALNGCQARVMRTGGHFFYSRCLAEIIETLVPQAASVAASLPPEAQDELLLAA